MAWKVKTKMEQKVEFICEWRTQKYSITELCRAFNISRPTAYKLIHRYTNYGIEGLLDRSTAHKTHPLKTSDEIINKIIQLKEKHKLRHNRLFPAMGAKYRQVPLPCNGGDVQALYPPG